MRRVAWALVSVAVLGAACSSEGTSPTAAPTTSTASTLTTAAVTSTTTTTAAEPSSTTAPEPETVVVTFDGALHPSSVTFTPLDSGVVEFRNETDQDWQIVARDEAFPTQVLSPGRAVTIDFGAMERGVYHFWVGRGGVRSPGSVDNQGIVFSATDLELITSWDGRLGFGLLAEPVFVWRFQGVADGIVAFPFSSDPMEDRLGRMLPFFGSTVMGEALTGPGLVVVVTETGGGDVTAAREAGEAALAGDVVPPNCASPASSVVEHSGLAGAEYRYACGDLELIRGYLVVPEQPAMLVYYDAATIDEEDRFHVETALSSIRVDPAGGLENEVLGDALFFPLDFQVGAAVFDSADSATVAIEGFGPKPAIARVGPWNTGALVFHNEDGAPYRLTWRSDRLLGGEVPAGGELTVALPEKPDGVYAYTLSFGRTGRLPGWIDAWASSPGRALEASNGEEFTISVPSPGAWFFFAGVEHGITGRPDHLWAYAAGEASPLAGHKPDRHRPNALGSAGPSADPDGGSRICGRCGGRGGVRPPR